MSQSQVWENHSSCFCQEGLPHLTEGRGPGARHWLAGAHGSYDQGRFGACVSKIPGGLLSDPLSAWVEGGGGTEKDGRQSPGLFYSENQLLL